MGRTHVWEVMDGRVEEWDIDPAAHRSTRRISRGWRAESRRRTPQLIERLLSGERMLPLRCAVLLNAAAALYVSGNGWTLEEAARRAADALEAGRRPPP